MRKMTLIRRSLHSFGYVVLAPVILLTPALGCSDPTAAESALAADVTQSQTGIFGNWQLDREASDDPRDVLPGDPHRMGPDRRPGRGPGFRAPPHRRDPGQFGTLEITGDAELVTITRGNGRSLALEPDGETREKELPNGDEISMRAYWDGDALVVERSHQRGTLTQRYERSAEVLHVNVTIDAERFDEPVQLRRVYDPAADDA